MPSKNRIKDVNLDLFKSRIGNMKNYNGNHNLNMFQNDETNKHF